MAQQGPVTLTLDAEGGDNAPGEIVAGALLAASPDLHVLLVGRPEIVEPLLGSSDHPYIEVVPSATVITFHDEPAGAVKSMTDSSIVVGARTVAEGRSQGFVSAGNTGAMLAAALLVVKRLSGIRRPAIVTTLPGLDGPGASARRRSQRGLPARASPGVRRAGSRRMRGRSSGWPRTSRGVAEHRRRGEQGQRVGPVGARAPARVGAQLRGQRRGARPAAQSSPTWWSPTASPATWRLKLLEGCASSFFTRIKSRSPERRRGPRSGGMLLQAGPAGAALGARPRGGGRCLPAGGARAGGHLPRQLVAPGDRQRAAVRSRGAAQGDPARGAWRAGACGMTPGRSRRPATPAVDSSAGGSDATGLCRFLNLVDTMAASRSRARRSSLISVRSNT